MDSDLSKSRSISVGSTMIPSIDSQEIHITTGIIEPSGSSQRTRRRNKPLTVRRTKKYIRRFIRSLPWAIFMIVVILYILFIDDFLAISKAPRTSGRDVGIGASKMVVLAIFVLEFIAQVFSNWRDFNHKSLFFWLDLLAIASMIPDIILLAAGSSVNASISMLAITRAGRAARASGRVARILRISQFYTCCGFNSTRNSKRSKEEDDDFDVEPSRLGVHVINTTTNKVVVIVLVLLFGAILLQEEENLTPYVASSVYQLEHMYSDLSRFSTATQNYLDTQGNVIFLRILDRIVKEDTDLMNGIFATSIRTYKLSSGSEVWLDIREKVQVDGAFNLALLVLVIILLTVGNLLIIRDANKMVISPIERMLAILKQLSPDGAATLFKKDHRKDTDATDDGTTSSSGGDDDDDDEAEAIFDMLEDIDGSLQAAKEKAEFESGENKRLKNKLQDIIAEKKVLEVHVAALKRSGLDVVDMVAEVLKKTRALATLHSAAPKLNFSLDIGGRKFASFMEGDQPDIMFHPMATAAELRNSSSGSASQADLSEYPQIKAATIDRMIERLSYEEYTDMKFINTFLLTYKTLLTPMELMDRLLLRYCITPSLVMSEQLPPTEHIESWRRQKQEPIRIGVCNVIKHWVGRYFWDFQDNPPLLAALNDFVFNLLMSTNMERHAAHMEMVLKKKAEEAKQDIRIPYTPPLPPITLTPEEIPLPTTIWATYGESDLNMYDMADLAAQITLIEHEMFRNIKPSELLGQVWVKKTKEVDAPNILRLIDHFNNMSSWLKTQIVRVRKAKHRCVLLKLAITLGTEFVKLNNFNGAMEVLAALSNAAVSRLKITWEQLPSSFKESFTELGNVMSSQSSYKLYREALRNSPPPSIPYIGVYLSDLVFIDEGNPDCVSGDLINFDKQRQIAAVINEVQKFQSTKYSMPRKDDVHAFILSMRGFDDDILYKISLITEPRARTASLNAGNMSPSSSSSFLQRLRSSSALSPQ